MDAKKFRKEAIKIQHRIDDWLDEPNSSTGRSLRNEIQKLEDELQVNKSIHTIRDRLKSLKRILQRAGSEGVMSYHHADELIDWVEDSLIKYR